jgi:spermidine synthase
LESAFIIEVRAKHLFLLAQRMKVLVLFFFSGATGLVYEILWSKYLSLLLGSTVHAQTIVLAAFMGGLALGNRLFGKRADFLARPVSIYGILEIIIGFWGFFFAQLYTGADQAFVALGSGLLGTPWLLLLKILLSALLLLPPTILMGGTLPLLAAWLENRPGVKKSNSANIGLFYAINSLGAVAGAALAGFYLVTNLGLQVSLQVTALANFAVGVAALIIGKTEEPLPVAKPDTALDPLRQSSGRQPAGAASTLNEAINPDLMLWLRWLVAITGGVSMGLEVLSARSIGMIVGASIQAFAIVLIAFILGISVGSIFVASSQTVMRRAKGMLYGLIASAGILVALYVLSIEYWVVIYSQVHYGLALNHNGYILHQFVVGAISIIVLGLPAGVLGAVLPLAMRLASSEGSLAGEKVGRLLTWNTLGAVVGVLITGFLLMPVFGLRPAYAIIALLLLGGVAVAARQTGERFGNAAIAVTACAAAILLLTGEGWRKIIASGAFRLRTQLLTMDSLRRRKADANLLYYKDGPDATVSVEQAGATPQGQLLLKINGKSDASTQGDLSTQYLLAHLPMMMRPDSKEVFVFGFGSGITAGAFLGHPIERITIAENCGPVLEAAEKFEPWNRGVRTNKLTRIMREDARTVLKLSANKYDIIVSEPSNPWVAGIGSVFSEEFYGIAANRLKDGGIMAQWFHMYEMSDPIVFLVVRTFAQVFPFVELWDAESGDVILLGSKRPWVSNPATWEKVFEREQPLKDLKQLNVLTAVQLWARQIASQRTGFAIPGEGPIQTDEFPILEYSAPQAFFIGAQAEDLFMFDERTFQYMVAPKEKDIVIRALPENPVLQMFATYPTCSRTLARYLARRAVESTGGTPEKHSEEPLFATMLRPYDSYPEKLPPMENMSPDQLEVLSGYLELLANRGSWDEQVKRMEASLKKILADTNAKPQNDFSGSFHASTIAKYYLAHGYYEDALRAIEIGAKFDRGNPQLGYVHRLAAAWSQGAAAMSQRLPSTNGVLQLRLPGK